MRITSNTPLNRTLNIKGNIKEVRVVDFFDPNSLLVCGYT